MLLAGFGKSSFVLADLGTIWSGDRDIGAVGVLMVADQSDYFVKSRLHVVCNAIDVLFPSTVHSPWTLSNTGYRKPSGSALRLGYASPKYVFSSRASDLFASDVPSPSRTFLS